MTTGRTEGGKAPETDNGEATSFRHLLIPKLGDAALPFPNPKLSNDMQDAFIHS